MKKASTAKNKKPDPAGQQRITNFFSKLSLKKSDVPASTNLETKEVHEKQNGKPVTNSKDELKLKFIDLTDNEDISIVKSLSKNTKKLKKQIASRKKISPAKQNASVITDDNNDFEVEKKQNVAIKNKSEELPSINVETKEFDEKQNDKSVSENSKDEMKSLDLTDSEVICVVKSMNNKKRSVSSRKSPKKRFTARNKISPVKQNATTDDDDDFVVGKKQNVTSKNKSVYEKLDVKYVEKISGKENKVLSSPKRVKKSVNSYSPPLSEKQNSVEALNNIFETTPDKTLLEKDELFKSAISYSPLLSEQQNSAETLNIIFETTSDKSLLEKDELFALNQSKVEEQNQLYCMSLDNTKKRKFEPTNSPELIPATPHEHTFTKKSELRGSKSKLRIENKFTEKGQETIIDQPSKIIKIDNEDPIFTKCVLEEAEVKNVNKEFEKSLNISDIENDRTISNNKVIELEPVISQDEILTQQVSDVDKNEEETYEILDDLDFDDGWTEEMDQIIEQEKSGLNLENWQYCKIISITRDLQQNIIAKLQSVDDKTHTNCLLQGVWQHTKLKENDLINIMAIKTTGNVEIPFCVNNNEGFVIFEPDLMISPTSIVSAQFCKRKGILSEKFRGFDPENKIMIIGTLIHRLLEHVLKNEIYEYQIIEETLMNILSSRDMMYTSYSSQVPLEEIKNELLSFIPKIVNFINKFIQKDTKNKKIVPKKLKKQSSDDWQGSIDKIRDIEENMWCPTLGIKGKVDITIETSRLQHVLPLELKTGRASMSLEHRGQVIMYIMMMNELGYNVLSGLLLYLREEVLKEVTTSHREKRDLVMLRNEFAYYMKQKVNLPLEEIKSEEATSLNSNKNSCNDSNRLLTLELPEPINILKACQMCPYSIICTTYLSQDNSYELSPNHPLKILSVELLSHLKQSHIDYFMHWTSLINLENIFQNPVKQLKHIWRLKPFEREIRRKSICYLNVTNISPGEDNNYIHIFQRSSVDTAVEIIKEKGLKNDFLRSEIVVTNYVVISTDNRPAIATGFVRSISENEVVVHLERNLSERYKNKILHIDTYESSMHSTFNMTSLAALLESLERPTRLRQLIIEKEPPKIPLKCTREVANLFKTSGKSIMKKLNKIQQRAILKSLIAEDFLLIKGMPGTGKTATLVALIHLLVLLNKTVLITSHTHSAVDNVCLRLLNCGVDFLRLGAENRVNPLIKHRTASVLTQHCKTVKEIEQVYNNAKVVAVTCLAAGHPLLSQRQLDVCIIDESTQVLQCSVIKALLAVKKFILIGDPDQLRPVVRNPEAVRRGMNESLFERLDNPESTITLNVQYRMNETITKVANSVTYKGELVCADDTIALAYLNLPKFEVLSAIYSETENWVLTALDTNIKNAVVGINTGPTWNINGILKTKESSDHLLEELQIGPQNVQEDEERRCNNSYEVALVVTIVEALEKAGVEPDTIGIIAPYRAQVELLKNRVRNIYSNCEKHVEVNTVDQYQGRDKNVIIYSCTKSRDTSKFKNNAQFEVLEDKRRLTVAITRAKHKLIIIGDFLTLRDYSPFVALLDSLEESQMIHLNTEKNKFSWKQVIQRFNK